MLTFCGWTPRATAMEEETHPTGVTMPPVWVSWVGAVHGPRGALEWTTPPPEGVSAFSPGWGTVFPEVLGQEAYFPNLKDRTSWGKINSSSSAPGKKSKRKFSHAENQVTREQPKKFSSAGDMCVYTARGAKEKGMHLESARERWWYLDTGNVQRDLNSR